MASTITISVSDAMAVVIAIMTGYGIARAVLDAALAIGATITRIKNGGKRNGR